MTSILAGLDFYKLTMSQQAWRIAPDAVVTFELKNRGVAKQKLIERISVEQLQEALLPYVDGFNSEDIKYLATLDEFDQPYRQELYNSYLPIPEVSVRDEELHVEVTGPWFLVTFWETIVMSTINDLYFRNLWSGFRTAGHNILSEKIRTLRMYHDIKISDFGTRRRYGFQWQGNVIERMAEELPEQFIGTSNPYYAREFGLKPIGTFAHELPMVYGGLAENMGKNPLYAHNVMLNDWYLAYGKDYSIALTDTFGSEFFFRTFGEQRAHDWKGLRHDSGNPFEFGHRAIEFYEGYGIDPTTKTIVFSDGLDLSKILALYGRFNGHVGLMFGWGTGLTNDVEVKPLNIVMKAVRVDGRGTVKLSDDAGKHTGSEEDVARYIALRDEAMA